MKIDGYFIDWSETEGFSSKLLGNFRGLEVWLKFFDVLNSFVDNFLRLEMFEDAPKKRIDQT